MNISKITPTNNTYNEIAQGRIFKYVTDPDTPLYKHDARFLVRAEKLMFDAPLFFSFLKETNQIEQKATDDECINSTAKGIAQYFLTKVQRIEKYGSFKKVIFVNIISWIIKRSMIFSYLVSGKGPFAEFAYPIDKSTPEDMYNKLEDNYFVRNTDDVYMVGLQKQFIDFNENNPIDAFHELAFNAYFVDSYCVYLFTQMDPEIMPSSLTKEEAEKFRMMLMQIVNLEFDKAFNYFEKEYYPRCLEDAKK